MQQGVDSEGELSNLFRDHYLLLFIRGRQLVPNDARVLPGKFDQPVGFDQMDLADTCSSVSLPAVALRG